MNYCGKKTFVHFIENETKLKIPSKAPLKDRRKNE